MLLPGPQCLCRLLQPQQTGVSLSSLLINGVGPVLPHLAPSAACRETIIVRMCSIGASVNGTEASLLNIIEQAPSTGAHRPPWSGDGGDVIRQSATGGGSKAHAASGGSATSPLPRRGGSAWMVPMTRLHDQQELARSASAMPMGGMAGDHSW